MGRKFIAIIDMDEEVAAQQCEAVGTDMSPGDYLDFQLGRLKRKGIQLEGWAITDDDVLWEQYCLYLVEWAIDHRSLDYVGMTPASYQEWLENEFRESEEESDYGCQ